MSGSAVWRRARGAQMRVRFAALEPAYTVPVREGIEDGGVRNLPVGDVVAAFAISGVVI